MIIVRIFWHLEKSLKFLNFLQGVLFLFLAQDKTMLLKSSNLSRQK